MMDLNEDAPPAPDNAVICRFGSIVVCQHTVECDHGRWWLWQTRWSWFDASTSSPGQAGMYWKPASVTLPLVVPSRPARIDPAIAVTVNGPDGGWQRCVVPVESLADVVSIGHYVEELDRWASGEQQQVGFEPAVKQYG